MSYQTFGITGADEAVILTLMILYDPNVPQNIKYQFIERITRFSNYTQIRAIMQKSDLAVLDSVLEKAAARKSID